MMFSISPKLNIPQETLNKKNVFFFSTFWIRTHAPYPYTHVPNQLSYNLFVKGMLNLFVIFTYLKVNLFQKDSHKFKKKESPKF